MSQWQFVCMQKTVYPLKWLFLNYSSKQIKNWKAATIDLLLLIIKIKKKKVQQCREEIRKKEHKNFHLVGEFCLDDRKDRTQNSPTKNIEQFN